MGSTKDTNPKDAIGITKTTFSTVPAPIIAEVGAALLEGALKYGKYNWRVVGVRASVYYDALQRHITSWHEGEDTDPDSGLSHITKAIACLVILRDAQIRGKLNDDRPPGTLGFVKEINKKVEELLERYPDPKDPYTHRDVDGPDNYEVTQ